MRCFENSLQKCFEMMKVFILMFYTRYIIAITCSYKAFHDLEIWKSTHFEWIVTFFYQTIKLIILICLNSIQTVFIRPSVHQTNLNFIYWFSGWVKDEVNIKFINHPASTIKLPNWQKMVEWPSILKHRYISLIRKGHVLTVL